MKILRITLKATSDFHTMGGVQGSTIDYLRNNKGVPYILGTHIKGLMRTEAERIGRSISDFKPMISEDNEKLTEDERRSLLTEHELKLREVNPDVCSVFGSIHTDGQQDYSEGKIRVTDFMADREIRPTARMHVSIDRDYLSNKKGALFRTRAVPAGSVFTGFVIARNLEDHEDKLLTGSIYSMAHYGIGGERSRGLGGFEVTDIEQIGYDEFIKEGVLV
jgi:CRISPR/Cas system CSM-associated protein Csm3 (group 7 of RAMP superfamily)